MLIGGKFVRTTDDLIPFPANRQLVGDPLEHGIAFGSAPQHEIRAGDVGVGDRRIVFHAGLAAELPPPLIDRAFHFALDPCFDRRLLLLPRRPHEHERIHERIVDRPLQAVMLA